MPIPLGVLAVAGAGAAPSVSDFELIQSTILTSTTSTITFSNLDTLTQYKHLQLRYTARGSRAATRDEFRIRFNSDSANNYIIHFLRANGSNIASGASNAQSWVGSDSNIANTPTPTTAFTAGVVDILDFSNANKFTTIRNLSGHTSDSDNYIGLASGLWRNTAAVTRMDITISLSSYLSGSRFSLYGIK